MADRREYEPDQTRNKSRSQRESSSRSGLTSVFQGDIYSYIQPWMSVNPSPPAEARPRTLRLHHIKLAVSRLNVALVWYERVLGAQRVAALDQYQNGRIAVVCEIAEWSVFVELREDPAQAAKDRGWDIITVLTQGQADIAAWQKWLTGWGTPHSQVLVGPRGWILVFQDPDGRRFKIYTQDRHDGSLEVSSDKDWLPGL